MSTRLSDEHCRQFREQGFCILPDCVPPEHLAILRGACEDAMAATDRRLDAEGTDVSGINHRGKRYFSTNTSLLHPELFDFIHSELMADSCRRLIGPDAWVFHEQYVVKCPGGESSFSWHQDSGYVGADTPHRPYLTCWVALDEITADNGTVFMLPYERAGVRERV
ncbi:MAG: phytanoyl-CoA dioxygenase family protein, partial [Planctomycetota bacterium]